MVTGGVSPAAGNVSGPASWQLTPADRARWELLAASPLRANAWVAKAAGCSVATVIKVRARLERDGLIEPVNWKARRTRAKPPEVELEQMARWSDVPPPDLSAGLCVGHPHADWWTSEDRAERRQAARICRQCPVMAECALWSLSLPDTGRHVVLGGMTPAARREARGPRQQRGGDHCGTCGAEMTPENTYNDPRGQRQCRACRRRRDRESRQRQAARRAASAA